MPQLIPKLCSNMICSLFTSLLQSHYLQKLIIYSNSLLNLSNKSKWSLQKLWKLRHIHTTCVTFTLLASYSHTTCVIFTPYLHHTHILLASYTHRTCVILTSYLRHIHTVLASYSHRTYVILTPYLRHIYTVLASYSHLTCITFILPSDLSFCLFAF